MRLSSLPLSAETDNSNPIQTDTPSSSPPTSASSNLPDDFPNTTPPTPSDAVESSGIVPTSSHEQSAHVGPESHTPLPTPSPVETNAKTSFPVSIPTTYQEGQGTPLPTSDPKMSVGADAPMPSASVSPAEACWWVNITFVFDGWPHETSWDVQRINAAGNNTILKAYNGTESDKYAMRKESICLQEGSYQFTVYDSGNDGMYQFEVYDSDSDGIYEPGNYNLTLHDKVIVQGGEFEAIHFRVITLLGALLKILTAKMVGSIVKSLFVDHHVREEMLNAVDPWKLTKPITGGQ